jgi:L-lysine 6-transaminase
MALTTISSLDSIKPDDVHRLLGRYMLADGLPLVFDFERSHGSWVHDARSGRELLDFMTFFGSGPIGYNHPKMKEPWFLEVLHRVAQLKPSLSDVYCVEYAWFVETLGRLAMPAHMAHAFFIEGGSLGVENALKTAFDWKVRRNRARGVPGGPGSQVIHFRQAFHGRSGYALSLTNTDPAKTDLFPKLSWPRIDNPKLRFPVTPEAEADVAAAEERALDQVRKAFADNPDDIAAIIIEPIQAEGGDNHFRAEFLQALERLARDNECLFIVDEVQTGAGLTGRMWAFEHFGLRPDVLAFGKKMQVCGCFVGPRVDEEPLNVFRVPSRISSTFGGGLTDMVRCARYLEIIAEDELVLNAKAVGEHLLSGLLALQDEMGGRLAGARGRGLMIAFDLPTPETRTRVVDAALDEGLLVLPCGPQSIRFRPPLNLSRAEADAGIERLRRALTRL